MRILLIEDDKKLCDSTAFQLRKEDMDVDVCYDGEEGLYYIREQGHDLILLDRMLPGVDGLKILSQIRAEGITTPIIFLTALGALDDKITGLDCGADDYLVKPFAFEELMARIRCIRRRPRELQADHCLTYGDISYQPSPRILSKDKESCSLSKREGDLLELLLRHFGQPVTREILLNTIWGLDADVEEGNLDNYIYFLRRRLKNIGSRLALRTLRGTGYILEDTWEDSHV